VTLVGILAVLVWTFRALGPALLILLNVPFACVGGAAAPGARAMPVSMPAAVGFIALSGIAVLNGVVLDGAPPPAAMQAESGWTEAARDASTERMRPVLMTALVALLRVRAHDPGDGRRAPRCSARWPRWWWGAS
jgi:cobalt-zinc-cadmium resistance protein CzcA